MRVRRSGVRSGNGRRHRRRRTGRSAVPVGSLQYDNRNDPNWPACGVCGSTTGVRARSARLAYGAWAATEGSKPVDPSDPSIYHIWLGSLDRTSGGQVRHGRAIAVPDSWASGVRDAEGRVGDVQLKRHQLPAGYLAGIAAAIGGLIALPYGEELRRCVRAAKRPRTA